MRAALRIAFFILIIIFIGSSLAFASDLGSQRTQENMFAIKVMPQEIADYRQDSAAKEDIQPLEPAIIEDIVKQDPKVMVAAPTYVFPFGTDLNDSILDILTTGPDSLNATPSDKKKRKSGAKKDNTSQGDEPGTSNPDQPTNPGDTTPGTDPGNGGGNTNPGNGGGNNNPGNGGGSGDGSTTPGNGNGGGNPGNGNNNGGGNSNSNQY